MKRLNTIIGLLIFLLAGCKTPVEKEVGISEFASLKGNTFLLEVKKTARSPQVTFPTDELKESDYSDATEAKSYTVSFAADGTTVTLEPGSLKGAKSLTGDNSRWYFTLTGGVFAGGRFEVWLLPAGYSAELTIYGSGLPIVLSERGNLVPGK